ncbi:hypothetical protein [Actinoplanes sp. NPDC051411]|uniref:hypothetical protein n=1 Tax=Actinoplanes sp. NPDC051411 TaxID=3155522 RepID=UPI00341B87D4
MVVTGNIPTALFDAFMGRDPVGSGRECPARRRYLVLGVGFRDRRGSSSGSGVRHRALSTAQSARGADGVIIVLETGEVPRPPIAFEPPYQGKSPRNERSRQ